MVPYPRRRSFRVNTFGKTSGDLYVPPQRGPPTSYASLTDNGTHAVTIEAVTLRSAGGRTGRSPRPAGCAMMPL